MQGRAPTVYDNGEDRCECRGGPPLYMRLCEFHAEPFLYNPRYSILAFLSFFVDSTLRRYKKIYIHNRMTALR